jgi:hypothetical protein
MSADFDVTSTVQRFRESQSAKKSDSTAERYSNAVERYLRWLK